MHGSLTFTRTLIPWGFTGRLELAIETPPEGLGSFVDGIVCELLPPEALRGESLTDRKGRDPNQLLNPTVPAAHLPRSEEIVFVAGRTPAPEEILTGITPAALTEPFTLSIASSFERFIGDHHIAHRTELSRSGAVADLIEPGNVGRMWPLVIDRFRFGLQYFRSHHALAFGYTPTVERTLLIDADRERIHLQLEIERLSSRSNETILNDDVFRNLSEIVRRATGHSCETIVRASPA